MPEEGTTDPPVDDASAITPALPSMPLYQESHAGTVKRATRTDAEKAKEEGGERYLPRKNSRRECGKPRGGALDSSSWGCLPSAIREDRDDDEGG